MNARRRTALSAEDVRRLIDSVREAGEELEGVTAEERARIYLLITEGAARLKAAQVTSTKETPGCGAPG